MIGYLNEALTAAEHSALIEEKQGLLDRPATHFLKLLQDMAGTMEALANHVMMVEQEAELLHEALGEQSRRMTLWELKFQLKMMKPSNFCSGTGWSNVISTVPVLRSIIFADLIGALKPLGE